MTHRLVTGGNDFNAPKFRQQCRRIFYNYTERNLVPKVNKRKGESEENKDNKRKNCDLEVEVEVEEPVNTTPQKQKQKGETLKSPCTPIFLRSASTSDANLVPALTRTKRMTRKAEVLNIDDILFRPNDRTSAMPELVRSQITGASKAVRNNDKNLLKKFMDHLAEAALKLDPLQLSAKLNMDLNYAYNAITKGLFDEKISEALGELSTIMSDYPFDFPKASADTEEVEEEDVLIEVEECKDGAGEESGDKESGEKESGDKESGDKESGDKESGDEDANEEESNEEEGGEEEA